MQTTININGIETTITLTPEQVAQIQQASKPKLFEYECNNTYHIGTHSIADKHNSINPIQSTYGRYRRTKKQAEMDFKRQTRMMRLSSLAWELGECVEWEYKTANWYIFLDHGVWKSHYHELTYFPFEVYMTEQTARKVCEMLNSGEYSLDVD
jgi:hypothetical protein